MTIYTMIMYNNSNEDTSLHGDMLLTRRHQFCGMWHVQQTKQGQQWEGPSAATCGSKQGMTDIFHNPNTRSCSCWACHTWPRSWPICAAYFDTTFAAASSSGICCVIRCRCQAMCG